MNILYFDCFSGISGDMILGALIDAGLDASELQSELAKLSLSDWHLDIKKVSKHGLAGTQVKVITDDTKTARKMSEILSIVEDSPLQDNIKNDSIAILKRIGEAESKIHGKPAADLHLHELGGTDTIIDVVGAVVGINKLQIDKVYSSSVHVGKGFVSCAHGLLPVPAPATVALLAQSNTPVFGRDIEAELTTPTGAAILTYLTSSFSLPPMDIKHIGYGAGERDLPIPNLLRVIIGQQTDATISSDYIQDNCISIEANIDDMNPELYSYLMDRLFQIGALDVYMAPLYMKKNRPAVLLGVITKDDIMEDVIDLILKETTTLGVRIHDMKRTILPREELRVTTKYGDVIVKVAKVGGKITNISPEYDSCRNLAIKVGVPLKEVYQETLGTIVNQQLKTD
ncbi:nickel pincer cofactor biosynthesis protein LarC [Chloroflexota bacterium]